ncbi:MAG: hypothetical protein WBN56_08375 [Robiginitalea sp.]|uniref:hypothetical protein n=1 Tax=Robiginitalea sp. TaxID=1902411 RepID=UPI003C73614E
MKKIDLTRSAILIIGSLGILSAAFMVIAGSDPMEYYFSFFSGLALVGTALLETKLKIDEL